jgi:ribosomal protein S18 acetylase RimI-like enzyme
VHWWSARTEYPLTNVALFTQWHGDADVAAYLLHIGDAPRAYGEIWIDKEDNTAELGRLLVDSRHRGRGLGRLLVERLVDVAQAASYHSVWMRVFPDNLPALRCYQAAGFCRVDAEEAMQLNAGQPFEYVWLVR